MSSPTGPMGSAGPVGKIGIVVPTYKEGESIAHLVREILKHVPQATIAIVDDTPDLSTIQAVESLHSPAVRLAHRTEKGGRGSAVLVGLRTLYDEGCTQFVEMDADFSHPPSQLPSLLQDAQSRQLDMLIASRYLPESKIINWPLSRRVFSKLSNILANALLQVPIHDYTNGYRIYSRPAAKVVLDTCGVLGKGFISLSEILVNLHYRDYRIGETPTVFTNRLRGESSVSRTEVWNALTGLFRIFFHIRTIRAETALKNGEEIIRHGQKRG